MLTIVASSTTISCAVPSSARTAHRFGAAPRSASAVSGPLITQTLRAQKRLPPEQARPAPPRTLVADRVQQRPVGRRLQPQSAPSLHPTPSSSTDPSDLVNRANDGSRPRNQGFDIAIVIHWQPKASRRTC